MIALQATIPRCHAAAPTRSCVVSPQPATWRHSDAAEGTAALHSSWRLGRTCQLSRATLCTGTALTHQPCSAHDDLWFPVQSLCQHRSGVMMEVVTLAEHMQS